MLLKKARPGSDSYGHQWESANSVVEVTDAEGLDLLSIKDAGFTVFVAPEPFDDEDEQPPTDPPAGTKPVAPVAPKPEIPAPSEVVTPIVEPAPVAVTPIVEPAPPAEDPIETVKPVEPVKMVDPVEPAKPARARRAPKADAAKDTTGE